MKKIKNYFYNLLFCHAGVDSKIFDGLIGFLVILSVAILPFYLFPYFNVIHDQLWSIETVIITIFSIEVILRIWVSKQRLKYIFSFSGIIDLLVLIPFFIVEFNIVEDSGIFIMLQFLRILRLIKLVKIYNLERDNIKNDESMQHGSFSLVEGEVIRQIVHKHYFIFLFSLAPIIVIVFLSLVVFLIFPSSIITLAIGSLLVIFAFIKSLKSWLDFHFDAMYITSNRLVIQNQHLFGVNRTEIPYRAITQVLPNMKGLIRSFFGFGDISIETAGETTNSLVKWVPEIEQVLKLVTGQIEEHRNPMMLYHQAEQKQKEEYLIQQHTDQEKIDIMQEDEMMNKKDGNILLDPHQNHPLFESSPIKEVQKHNYKKIFSLFSTTNK